MVVAPGGAATLKTMALRQQIASERVWSLNIAQTVTATVLASPRDVRLFVGVPPGLPHDPLGQIVAGPGVVEVEVIVVHPESSRPWG